MMGARDTCSEQSAVDWDANSRGRITKRPVWYSPLPWPSGCGGPSRVAEMLPLCLRLRVFQFLSVLSLQCRQLIWAMLWMFTCSVPWFYGSWLRG